MIQANYIYFTKFIFAIGRFLHSLFLKNFLQYFTDYLEKAKDMINLTITHNAISFNKLKLHKFLFA